MKGQAIMRKILDKIFGNKKISFWLPIVFATVVYLLFLFFGKAEYKNQLLITIPLATAFWFFGLFLLVFIQVKNPRCPEWFLNVAELGCTVIFTGASIIESVSFIISGFQNFSPVICAGIVTYSSISWAHNKRTKKDD